MKRARAAAVLLALAACAAPVIAQDEPTAVVAEETDPAVIEVRDKLKNDPAFADSVAQRVAKSRLIARLTTDSSEEARVAAAQSWIKDDPAGAAHIALGLSSDDMTGTTNYEDALLSQLAKQYDANPGASKNTFGRLSKTAKDSKLLKKQADGMSDDEKREILRNMFEGQGSESSKVITDKNEGQNRPPSDKGGGRAATAFNGIYDRLNAGNLRGYSPQLMSLQSALSAHRPPGAPALVETGKLDYQTLAYPAYGMHYDIDNLQTRLNRENIIQLAKLAGRTLTAEDWKDPTLEIKLSAQVPPDKLPARLKRRASLLGKARAAQAAFVDAAEKAKNPNAITRALLVDLGGKQKETARWIADAALEEELSRVDELEGFLTPELLAAVDAAPAPAEERAAYKARGAALQAKVAKLKGNAVKAQGLLEADAWAGSLGEVDKLVAENHDLKRTLPSDVRDYARVPYAVAESMLVQPRWRVWLDDLAVKWASSLSYSRGVALRRGRLARCMNVFGLIASGDAAGAHAALVNETGER
jgi:hypothetical protein